MADAADGVSDGKWRGHDFADLRLGFDTPARVPYQTRAIEEVIRREGFGHHEGTDLLFLNYKLIDEVGHLYSASSPEMRDSVRAQDRHLAGFIDFMDNRMGLKGEWVLLLTADHGHAAHRSVSRGFIINGQRIMDRIQERFDTKADGRPVVQQFRPMWLELDEAELEANGVTYDKISKLVAGITKADASPPGKRLSADQAEELVFDAVFAGNILDRLPCLPEARTG